MRLDDLPVLSTLKSALEFNAARSETLAQNIANVDTPGYIPRDIAEGDFAAAMAEARGPIPGFVTPARTHDAHFSVSTPRASAFNASRAHDHHITIDGNAVVVEEQMAKVGETRTAFDAALSVYQKTLDLVRMAAKSPSR